MTAFFQNKLGNKIYSFSTQLSAYCGPDAGRMLVKRQASSCSRDAYRLAEEDDIRPTMAPRKLACNYER